MGLMDRLTHAWNALVGNDSPPPDEPVTYSHNLMYQRYYRSNKSQFASAIFSRIALDVSVTRFNHVIVNPKNEDITIVKDGLNYCLNTEANIDQSGVAFIYDMVYSMLDEGLVAVVPIETTFNPKISEAFDIKSLRVGKVIGQTTTHVNIEIYSDRHGDYKQIWLPKRSVALIENPLYSVVNAQNSTLMRLLTKMTQLDMMDQYYANNRIDLILQMPQALRTESQQEAAKKRITMIEQQLSHGNNGVAYIDATEKITQVNRPANSQLTESIDKLKKDFFNQLGLTQAIFDGTANESQLRQYYTRTIDTIVIFIIKEMERKFLSKTARTQGHAIEWYRDLLKFVSAEQIISLGDAFRRNEIATSNEIRQIIGLKRSNEPSADELRNPNIADKNQMGTPRGEPEPNQNDDQSLEYEGGVNE